MKTTLNQRMYDLAHNTIQAQQVFPEMAISNLDMDEMIAQGINYRLSELEAKWAEHEAKFEELTSGWDETKYADRCAMDIIKRNNEAKAHKEIVDWTKALASEVEKSDRFYVEVEWNY